LPKRRNLPAQGLAAHPAERKRRSKNIPAEKQQNEKRSGQSHFDNFNIDTSDQEAKLARPLAGTKTVKC
jgi:hypothetical protein